VFVIYGSLGLFWNFAWQKLVADYPPLAALSKTQAATATAVQQQAPGVQPQQQQAHVVQQQQQQGSVALTTVQQQQQQAAALGGLSPLPRVRDLPWKEFFTNKAFLAIVMAHSAFGELQAGGCSAVSQLH
jgi:hypothetical protein